MNRLLLLILLIPHFLYSQTSRKSALVANSSAFSLGVNEWEINIGNSFGYNLRQFDFGRSPYQYLEDRVNIFQSGLQVTYGLTQSRLLNIGLDLNQVSIFPVNGTSEPLGYFQLGPRIRWRPFGALTEGLDVSIQNSVLWNLGDRLGQFEQQPTFRNQVIASQFVPLSSIQMSLVFQGIVEANLVPRSTAELVDRKPPVVLPVSLLVGLLPNENWVIFGVISQVNELGTIPWVIEDDYFTRRTATTASIGFQYLIARKHALFLSHSFLLDEQYGGGSNSISFGLRLLFLQSY